MVKELLLSQLLIKDINDILPKFPGMKWGVLLNWRPEQVEINRLIKSSPFPNDAKWHTMLRPYKDSKETIIDGKVIRDSDDSKLT